MSNSTRNTKSEAVSVRRGPSSRKEKNADKRRTPSRKGSQATKVKEVVVIPPTRAAGKSSLNLEQAMAKIRSKAPVSATAKAVMLPLTHAARFAAGWTTAATVLGKPYTIQAVDVTTTVPTFSTPPILKGGSYIVAVSRDPLNAIMEYVPTPNIGWGYKFKMIRAIDTSGVSASPTIEDTCLVEFGGMPVPTVYRQDLYPGDTSLLHPFGSISFCRQAREIAVMKFTWLDIGTRITAKFWSDAAGTVPFIGASGGFEFLRWDGSAAVPAHKIVFTGVNQVSWVVTDAGNYSFYITSDLQHYMSMLHDQGDSPAGVISHRPLPGILDQTTMTGIRVLGASVMVTPDCAELAKGGWSIGAQVDTAYVPESFIVNNTSGLATDTLANLPGSVGMDFTNGMYAWHRPRSEKAFDMQRPYRFNLDYAVQSPDARPATIEAVSNYISYMDPPDGWLFIAVNTPPNITGGSTSFPGGLLHTTFAWSVEYTSNNVWLSPKTLTPTRGEFDDLMEALAKAPQFEENSFHVQQLLAWLRGELRHIGSEGNMYIRTFGPHLQSALQGALTIGDRVTRSMSRL